MKIIHTADWHIGQSFFGYDRKAEHLFFLDWLKSLIKERSIDLLLISGDVFDSPNPSAESQKTYYKFLKEVTSDNPHLQTIIIAGNHDSAARLEAPNPLLEEMNVSVKGTIKRNNEGEIDYTDLLIPIQRNNQTEAWCIAVPYLRQGDYPNADNYGKGVAAMYDILYDKLNEIRKPNEGIIVMGHLQAANAEISGNDRSERTVIGGLESVPVQVFDKENVLYTALGHLHKAQKIDKDGIRYAGSPLPMSFTEKYYQQGVNLIATEGNKLINIERIEFEPLVKLLSIPDEPEPLIDVLKELKKLPEGDIDKNSPYLEVKILITQPEPSMRHQIEEILKTKSVRLARLASYTQAQQNTKRTITYEELKTIDPLDIAQDTFRNKYGNEMPDTLKKLLQNVIREVEL